MIESESARELDDCVRLALLVAMGEYIGERGPNSESRGEIEVGYLELPSIGAGTANTLAGSLTPLCKWVRNGGYTKLWLEAPKVIACLEIPHCRS